MKRKNFAQRVARISAGTLVSVNQSARFLRHTFILAVLGWAASVTAQTAITNSNDPALTGAGVMDAQRF